MDPAHPFTVSYFAQRFCIPSSQTLTLIYDPSVSEHASDLASIHRTALHSRGALELILTARSSQKDAATLDLVIGRAAPKRKEPSERARTETPAPRPDDPLPRARRPSLSAWDSSDDERTTALDVRVRKRGHVELTPERPRHTGHTPGRRGEKRPVRNTASTPDTAFTPIAAALSAPGAPSTENAEEANRALIKRLVRYQLVGSGMERGERDFDPCFQAAYAGTCVVFVRISL